MICKGEAFIHVCHQHPITCSKRHAKEAMRRSVGRTVAHSTRVQLQDAEAAAHPHDMHLDTCTHTQIERLQKEMESDSGAEDIEKLREAMRKDTEKELSDALKEQQEKHAQEIKVCVMCIERLRVIMYARACLHGHSAICADSDSTCFERHDPMCVQLRIQMAFWKYSANVFEKATALARR